MKVKFSNRGVTLIASMSGELDHHWAEYLRDKVDTEIFKSRTKNVVFDFSDVTFMDSSGIGVLLGRYKNVMGLNGKIAAANLSEVLARLFEMSGLVKIIPVFDNIDDAVSKLKEVGV